jgi:hypothetical protein
MFSMNASTSEGFFLKEACAMKIDFRLLAKSH